MFAVPANTLVPPASRAAAHPVRIAREFAVDLDRWRHLLRYDPDERWVGLIERTDDVEVWLLSWLPGQHTELHDHTGAAGAFTVVSGTLTECVIRSGRDDVSHTVASGQSRVFGPEYVHQVSNIGVEPAISVHVYRPCRVAMTNYRLDTVAGLVRL